MDKPKHSPEPWEAGWGRGVTGATCPTGAPFCGGRKWPFTIIRKGFEVLAVLPMQEDQTESHEANAARIVACVNALAGVEDPAKALQAARDALEKAALLARETAPIMEDDFVEALALLTPKP